MFFLISASAPVDFDLLLIFIRYVIDSLADSLSCLASHEILKPGTVLGILISSLTTGFGIVFGNFVINYVKFENQKKDISKILNWAIQTQFDDFYNIKSYLGKTKGILITHYNTITNHPGSQNNLQSVDRERKNILRYVEKIMDLENTIRISYVLNFAIDSIKMFKSKELVLISRYLRQIKILLEDLRIFYSYEIPNSMIKFDGFPWSSSIYFEDRIDSMIADIDIFFCLGFMTKMTLNLHKIDNEKNIDKSRFDKSYENISLYLTNQGFMPLNELDIQKLDNLNLHSCENLEEIKRFKLSSKTYKKIKN